MQTAEFEARTRAQIMLARAAVLTSKDPMVIIIEPDYRITVQSRIKKPQLDELQEIVKGYIEAVPSPYFGEVYCNEESKFSRMPANEVADIFTGFDQVKMESDFLAGPVVILQNFDETYNGD